ncbi:MAG: DHH family phosphoesterase [Methanomassiliicoccales archaeon]|nr:MAG: DHH family phosphoesterase [Methanomassiliicoccales archaeon]
MFESVLERFRTGRKLILIHGNADPDAFGSAYAIMRTFPDVDICAPNGLDRVSKVISKNFGYEPLSKADVDHYDTIIVVDTSSPEQLGAMNSHDGDWIVIDHHARSDKWGSCHYFCDETRRSCAELVYDLIRESGSKLGKDAGLGLLAGMMTDSGHFRFATPGLLSYFAMILEETGIQMDQVYDLTDLESDVSERIAMLKGAQRLRFERVGDYIVAVSLGSSFESSVCKGLLSIGADITFVVSQRDESFRLSARARQEMVRAGLHLGRMLEDIGKEVIAEGGGHPGAAGLTGIGDAEAISNICMARSMDFLRSLVKKEK